MEHLLSIPGIDVNIKNVVSCSNECYGVCVCVFDFRSIVPYEQIHLHYSYMYVYMYIYVLINDMWEDSTLVTCR